MLSRFDIVRVGRKVCFCIYLLSSLIRAAASNKKTSHGPTVYVFICDVFLGYSLIFPFYCAPTHHSPLPHIPDGALPFPFRPFLESNLFLTQRSPSTCFISDTSRLTFYLNLLRDFVTIGFVVFRPSSYSKILPADGVERCKMSLRIRTV